MQVSPATAKNNNEIIIQSTIDEAFIEKAEQEAFTMILYKQSDFGRRWNKRWGVTKERKARLRKITLPAGGLLVVVSIIASFVFHDFNFLILSVLTLMLFLLDYYQDKIEHVMQQWSIKQSKKQAKVCMGNTRQHVPFLATYQINQNNIIYFRAHNRQKNHLWTRNFKGVAMQGNNVTLFFRKWTTLSPPIMVILHETATDFHQAFELNNIDYRIFEKVTNENKK